MAYIADLVTVLKLLFEQVTQSSSSETPRVTRQALTEVYQAYKMSGTRRQIYQRISADFQQKRQIPGRDEDTFRRLLRELLGYEPVSAPDPEGAGAAASSPLSPGVVSPSHSAGMATGTPPPSGLTGVTALPPNSTRMRSVSPKRNGVPAASPRSTSPPVWSCLFPCLTSPSQHS